ncbi:MAG: hypothetical protein MJ131_11295 [Lachnospiraceae bacterium]|nr:hypothetical protein [Lachnospiraceae bacterium]
MADTNIENKENPVTVSEEGSTENTMQNYLPAANQGESGQPSGKKKGMKKGVKIAIISVVSLLVIAGAAFAILYATKKEYVQNWWAMLTKSDTEYYQWIADRSLERNVEQVRNSEFKKPVDSAAADVKLGASVSKEFGELIGIDNFEGFKNVGLEFKGSKRDNNEFGISLTPFYNGENILQLASNFKLDSGEMYIGIPDYSLDSISLSDYFGRSFGEIFGGQIKAVEGGLYDRFNFSESDSLASLIKGMLEKSRTAAGELNPEEYAELYNKLLTLLKDSVDEAVLAKDVQLDVRGITTECNTVTAKIKKKALLETIEGYFDIIGEKMLAKADEKTREQLNGYFALIKEKLEKLFEEEAIGADIVLYVDGKGDFLGGELKITYNEIKVKITALTEQIDENTSKTGIEIELNTVRALNIVAEYKKTDSETVLTVNARPGAMITSFIGKKDICLLLDWKSKTESDGDCLADLDIRIKEKEDAAENLAAIALNVQSDTKGADSYVTNSGSRVYTIDKFADTEYIDVTKAANFVIDRIDAINDIGFNNFVANMLGNTPLGVIDPKVLLVNLRDTGVTDMLTNQLKIFADPDAEEAPAEEPATDENTNTEDGEGVSGADENTAETEPEEPEEEIIPEPEVFVPYDYSSSKAFLADYVEELKYSGLEYDPKIYITVDEDPTVARNSFLEICARDSYFTAPDGYGVQMGDEFYFSACAVVAGFVVDGYSYDDCYALMGRYDYGAGIDDLIVGMKVGERKDLQLTLDSRFGAFEGYTGTFRITCTDIKRHVEPEWTEDYIVGCLGYESLDACDLSIGNTGEPSIVFTGEYKTWSTVYSELKAAVFESLKLRDFDSAAYTKYRIIYDREKLKAGEMTYYEFFENEVQPTLAEGSDISSYRDSYFREMVNEQMITDTVMAYIAVNENIYIHAEDMEALVSSYAEPRGFTMEQIFEKYGEESVNNNIVNELAEQYIYSSAVRCAE